MLEQLGLFGSASPAADPCLTKERAAADDAWPHHTWRFGPGHSIEYREPEPTSPSPPAVRGGEWAWNPLVPGWRIDYPAPSFSLDPRGESADRHGPKLLPPPGFLEIDRRRLAGRCPHCGEQSGGRWSGPGWCGWSDPRVAAAFEAEEAAGRRCYGLTVLDVPGLGPINPLSHYTRWGAGFCASCGAVSWNDFRDPASAYYRPPAKAVGPGIPAVPTPPDAGGARVRSPSQRPHVVSREAAGALSPSTFTRSPLPGVRGKRCPVGAANR